MTSRALLAAGASAAFQPPSHELVQVRIGEVSVARHAAVLCSVGIGSCVAVAMYDSRTRTAGLAHVMLPHPSRAADAAMSGRFASMAVPELLTLMQERGAARGSVRARIAGGASMFSGVLDGDGLRLGRRNVDAVRAALLRAGVPVDGEDVFGAHGRSIFLRTTDGTLLITAVGRDDLFL
jgi:chemotaxis protein CheD